MRSVDLNVCSSGPWQAYIKDESCVQSSRYESKSVSQFLEFVSLARCNRQRISRTLPDCTETCAVAALKNQNQKSLKLVQRNVVEDGGMKRATLTLSAQELAPPSRPLERGLNLNNSASGMKQGFHFLSIQTRLGKCARVVKPKRLGHPADRQRKIILVD